MPRLLKSRRHQSPTKRSLRFNSPLRFEILEDRTMPCVTALPPAPEWSAALPNAAGESIAGGSILEDGTLASAVTPAGDWAAYLPGSVRDSLLADPSVQPITWQNQETFTMKGQWIAGFDSVSGSPKEQLVTIQNWLATTGIPFQATQQLGMDGVVLIQGPDDLGYTDLQAALGPLPGYQYVEPNLVQANALTGIPTDPSFGQLYGLHNTGQSIVGVSGTADADIDAPEAWDITTGSGDIVVAVIDSGVDYNHPDLAANMWTNSPEVNGVTGVDDDGNGYTDDIYGYDFYNGDANPFDDLGHGTHVAGTIGAAANNAVGVAGVNWNVKIMAVKWINSSNFGTTAGAVASVNYVTHMRQRGVNVKLSNNSWHVAPSEALRQAIVAHGDAGLLFVVAAGNDGANRDLVADYPSSYDLPNMITVAATDNRDNKASFSTYGLNTVDLGAPGVNVLSTTPANTYSYFSGTSMATPHVAGVVALGWSYFPDASKERIKNAILAGVDPISALRRDGPTPVGTGGRLNAYGTLQQLRLGVVSSQPAAGDIVAAVPTTYVITSPSRSIP